jgi:hypothetical protein
VSRGLGAVQREVLQQLDIPDIEAWTTVAELAGAGATRARIESVRRAVLGMRDAGLVDVTYVPRMRRQLAARLALHPDHWPRRRVRDVARQDAQIARLRAALDRGERPCDPAIIPGDLSRKC